MPGGIEINILKLPYYLASKVEAFTSRGKENLIMSHDLEDIFLVLKGQSDFEKILDGPDEVVSFLRSFFRQRITTEVFVDHIYGEFQGHEVGQTRASKLVSFFKSL